MPDAASTTTLISLEAATASNSACSASIMAIDNTLAGGLFSVSRNTGPERSRSSRPFGSSFLNDTTSAISFS
ncbi:hypothetical protein D9M72_624500 [compost metagenome]